MLLRKLSFRDSRARGSPLATWHQRCDALGCDRCDLHRAERGISTRSSVAR
jgi:hypothetical protein